MGFCFLVISCFYGGEYVFGGEFFGFGIKLVFLLFLFCG